MQADTIIIGAGPVGLGLAIDLALRGTSVCVCERHQQPQRVPKGQNLTQRTGEHFKAWGVSEPIRAATPIPASYGNEGLTAYGSVFSGYHYDWFKRASVRAYYATDNERLPQYETERVLRERALSLPNITLLTNHAYINHLSDSDGVIATIENRSTQKRQEIKGTFLVGCDGARSAVREQAGISQSLDARDKRMALLVFNSRELHDMLEASFPGKTIFNALHPDLEGYWQFLGRVDLHHNWFFHAPVPDDATVDNFDFESLLTRAVGAKFSVDFEHIGLWDLRFTQADTYQNDRVFIAGDAAHSHPPYGGYGVNVGFEDARNLSWKLAASLRGWGNNALLASYTTERHPVFASTRDHFIARMIDDDARFTARFNPADDLSAFKTAWDERAAGGQAEVQLYVPNYAGSPIVCGTPGARSGAVGEHSAVAQPGFHLMPHKLDDGRPVYDALGPDFTLIAIGQPEQVIKACQDAANTLSIPLTIIRTASNDETAQLNATLLLVRPDQYIAFAGNGLERSAYDLMSQSISNN